MRKLEQVKLTNMCLIYRDDEILVQMRHKDDWPGLTFPGGHIEKDECIHDAIIREVYEETGLTLLHPILCGIEEFKTKEEDRYLIFFYKCNEFIGDIKDSSEGEVFWIKRKDLEQYELSLDLLEILKVIEDDSISELHYFMQDGIWQKRLI